MGFNNVDNSIEKNDWLRDIDGTFVYSITHAVVFVSIQAMQIYHLHTEDSIMLITLLKNDWLRDINGTFV